MEQYHVTGMSCAACSTRVEKAVSGVPGVDSCSVSLLTNSMGVEGTASSADIIAAVEAAGYGASLKGGTSAENGGMDEASGNAPSYSEDDLKDTETPKMIKRLSASLVFLLILMYFSMGHHMWGWPVPAFFADNHVALGILQMLLTIIVMVINQRFFISGFKGIIHRAPNMDTLVALGAGAAFGYSVWALFAMTGAVAAGDMQGASSYMNEFYFESAAMILTLITIGKTLEAKSKGKTTDALKQLMRLAPKTATLVRDGQEVTVPIAQVRKGDIFVLRPGDSVPVDGLIIEGNSALNESALTGESIPVDKTVGDQVSAATVNLSGYLKAEATRVGEDTTLSQIIRMVSDAAATKAPIARIADQVSGIFVPAVICIAAITFVVWMIVGRQIGFSLSRAISVLVISCPCALGLATPVAIMVGNGVGAKNGILFKTAASLEETGRAQIVALDKTGTITKGEPVVTDMVPVAGISEEELLRKACTLEQHSEHPLAKAVMKKSEEDGCTPAPVVDFEILPGNGLKASSADKKLVGGNLLFIEKMLGGISSDLSKKAQQLSEQGKTPLFFAEDGKLLGIIAVADEIKPDSAQAVTELKNMGLHVVMLTGDNERTAKAIGRTAGVDEVAAGVLPDGKEAVIRELQQKGKVIMVGDGINDAPALTRAEIGIAIGAGTDVAIDAADVVLMNSRLTDVSAAIRLSRSTLRNIHQNLFWAFFYNVIGIPLAAGVWIPLFGWQLNPMFGAAAMSLSSFCVVTNALRLNLCKVHNAAKDKKMKDTMEGPILKGSAESTELLEPAETTETIEATETTGDKTEDFEMKKTMKIEGMMCGHCSSRVKKALEALDQVDGAEVSFNQGTAIVTLNADVDDAVLKKAVEDQDYKVLEIR